MSIEIKYIALQYQINDGTYFYKTVLPQIRSKVEVTYSSGILFYHIDADYLNIGIGYESTIVDPDEATLFTLVNSVIYSEQYIQQDKLLYTNVIQNAVENMPYYIRTVLNGENLLLDQNIINAIVMIAANGIYRDYESFRYYEIEQIKKLQGG